MNELRRWKGLPLPTGYIDTCCNTGRDKASVLSFRGNGNKTTGNQYPVSPVAKTSNGYLA